ncbi:hypothetical protein MVI01_45670 [Myxococcus virescens]|uniref:Transposase IS701-like DDE domain-containing protein n=1 Tax=Myxococcus virescens TaxID=83456 RepID=A0A511HGT4_9BACT|nr:hypothetical protein MVI01_45670 [Myxococcus virescens]
MVVDEVYGRDNMLRRILEELRQPYVLTVAANTHVSQGFCQVKPGDMVQLVPPTGWSISQRARGARAHASMTGHECVSTGTWAYRGGFYFVAASWTGRWLSTLPTHGATPRWPRW